MTSLIQVDQLYRFFSGRCAVNNVSFKLERGEILGFLGPNGAGKTTTMQMICGNLAPTEGQIFINGIDILDQPKEAKRELGYLPETPPLYRELTADEYLGYCARLHRLPAKKIATAVGNAKERCGLTEVGRRLIGPSPPPLTPPPKNPPSLASSSSQLSCSAPPAARARTPARSSQPLRQWQ